MLCFCVSYKNHDCGRLSKVCMFGYTCQYNISKNNDESLIFYITIPLYKVIDVNSV